MKEKYRKISTKIIESAFVPIDCGTDGGHSQVLKNLLFVLFSNYFQVVYNGSEKSVMRLNNTTVSESVGLRTC
jgi:hypothetical protein